MWVLAHMLEELELDDQLAEDVDFSEARSIYRAGFRQGNPNLFARWDRIQEEVSFEDVVAELTGETRSPISCPFHGRDSRPSFYIYKNSNNGWCFGCPPGVGTQLWDAVRFAREKLECSNTEAIEWLEAKYDLPPLEAWLEDEEEEEGAEPTKTIVLTFSDLKDAFIRLASEHIIATNDTEVIREYMEAYFDGRPDKEADPASDAQLKRLMPMARILGREKLQEIARARYH